MELIRSSTIEKVTPLLIDCILLFDDYTFLEIIQLSMDSIHIITSTESQIPVSFRG